MKGEKERFEEWWAIAMGTSMKGSKYLARNAWIAALWAYEVNTKPIESSGGDKVDQRKLLHDTIAAGFSGQAAPSPAPTIKKDLTVAPLPAEVEEAMEYIRRHMEICIGTLDALAVIRAALKYREGAK